MKSLFSILAIGLTFSMGLAHAADGEGKSTQQNKMATCNADAGEKKERMFKCQKRNPTRQNENLQRRRQRQKGR